MELGANGNTEKIRGLAGGLSGKGGKIGAQVGLFAFYAELDPELVAVEFHRPAGEIKDGSHLLG